MKQFLTMLSLTCAFVIAGCATTPATTAPKTAVAADDGAAEKNYTLGSRIPRTTTDRVVKSTDRDLANEPTTSIGNRVNNAGSGQ